PAAEPKPAEPAGPAEPGPKEAAPPKPAEPAAEPRPDEPAEPKPAEPAAPGPAPAAPGPAGPPPAPAEDLRPTLTVAEFFGEAADGQKGCEGARMQASWATNQGERAFDTAELKEHFTLGPGEALPLVDSQDPARPGGVLLLQVRKPGFAWWTVRLAPADGKPVSLLPYLRNGRLELAVRGEMGGETIRVGLADASDPPKPALLSLDRVAKVTTTWQVLRIPLRALRAVVPDLDFEHVTALWLTSASGRPLTLYLDDLRVVNPVGDGGR
ncbi:MAG: hypothetical protein HYU66_21400, partial [Armatimonadetes bacterium]|nr:hypothetical protein [Armatimonadota bacterium]